MEILTPKDREALSKYPLYSQDGKQGEAVAVVRLFITGTAATYYITEANLRRRLTKSGGPFGFVGRVQFPKILHYGNKNNYS